MHSMKGLEEANQETYVRWVTIGMPSSMQTFSTASEMFSEWAHKEGVSNFLPSYRQHSFQASTPMQVSVEIPEKINITHTQSVGGLNKSEGRVYRCQLALERGVREPYFSSMETNIHSGQETCCYNIPMGFCTPLSKLTPLRSSEAAASSPDISLITSASATTGPLTGQENCIVLFSNLVASNSIVPKIQVRPGPCVTDSMSFSSFLFEELYLGMPSQTSTAWPQSKEQPQRYVEKDQAEVEKTTKPIQNERSGIKNGDEDYNAPPAIGLTEGGGVHLHGKAYGDFSNSTHNEGFVCKVDEEVEILSTEGSKIRTSGSNKSLITQPLPISPRNLSNNESFHLLNCSSTLSLDRSNKTDMHYPSILIDQPNINRADKRSLSIRSLDAQELSGDKSCIQRGDAKKPKQSSPISNEILALQHTESGVFDTCRFPECFALASMASILAIDSMLSSYSN